MNAVINGTTDWVYEEEFGATGPMPFGSIRFSVNWTPTEMLGPHGQGKRSIPLFGEQNRDPQPIERIRVRRRTIACDASIKALLAERMQLPTIAYRRNRHGRIGTYRRCDGRNHCTAFADDASRRHHAPAAGRPSMARPTSWSTKHEGRTDITRLNDPERTWSEIAKISEGRITDAARTQAPFYWAEKNRSAHARCSCSRRNKKET